MEPDFMEPPPVLQRQYAIGPGSELTANDREDIRIAREDELREARNMDNMIADNEAANEVANPNRGGRKSRRRRMSKKSRRSKKQRRQKKTRMHKKTTRR
jgi:hypothetical protein